MVRYEQRTTELAVVPAEESRIYDGRTMRVRVDDEGAGEFVIVFDGATSQEVRINEDVWPMLRASIDEMLSRCRQHNS